jgi:hypothetical protein
MSNPVEPTQYGAGEPNAGAQAFPPPNTAGAFPPPNAGAPGAPGFPPPNTGAPGFPPPGTVAPGFPGAPEAPKKSFGKTVLKVLGVIVVLVIAAVIKFAIGTGVNNVTDDTKQAAAGDCVNVDTKVKEGETGSAEAEVVKCTDAKAQYTVVGRVEGVTDVNSPSCEKFYKEGEEMLVYSTSANGGYLLCLKPKA